MNYQDFIDSKRIKVEAVGFDAGPIVAPLFPFQRRNVEWACRLGRCALFLDTGLGKTAQQLEWASQVCNFTGGRVLILAPLAVGKQTAREADKFGITGARYALNTADANGARIAITNYERLTHFNAADFVGVVLDESGILKSYSGTTRNLLQNTFERTPYKLTCSATPSPNDHLELGTQAEFLGVMSSHQMIARWFITDQSSFGTYRLKGHAVEDFWDWVSSWAVMAGKPSDIGNYDDGGYVLPPLTTHQHIVKSPDAPAQAGQLFRVVEMNATSVHTERRLTAAVRAQKLAELVDAEPEEQWLVWCETDYEADAIMAALAHVKGLCEVRGSDSQESKETGLMGFASGDVRVLVTKPKIAGFGMNWQNCARVAFACATFSFESYYQAIRRSWRFGQTRPVHSHVIMADTERPVWAVLERKRSEFEVMQRAMMDAACRNRQTTAKAGTYNPTKLMQHPLWSR